MANGEKGPETPSVNPPPEGGGPSEEERLLGIIQQQKVEIENLKARAEVGEAAQKALQEKVDNLAQQLQEEQEKHRKERERLKDKLKEMGALEKAAQFAGWGLGKLEHPKVRRDEQGNVEEGKEPYEDLKEQYGEILLREIEKMETRKPLPWDNWRTLWLIDFIEQIPSSEQIVKEIGPEKAEDLAAELMEYLEMREAIWNRICWHERSLGYIKVICAEDSPQPRGEQIAEFENDPFRPEVRAAIEVFLNPRLTGWFVDEEGNLSTPYTEMLMTAGSEREFYRLIEQAIIQKTKELTEGKVVLSRSKAKRAREIAEGYLRAIGFISTLDPAMKRNINDQLNEGMFGGTRNRERTDAIKPTGPAYGAGLFVDRLVYPPGEREKVFNATFDRYGRDPFILLEGYLAGEPQYMGSLYHQTTVEARISPDGRSLILTHEGVLGVDYKTRRPIKGEEARLEIPIEGIGIRGKPLATQEAEIEENGESKRVKVAEPKIRGEKVTLRLIDLMTNLDTGEIKPLPREIWQFLDNQVFGGLLLGWAKASELGFYGLTCKPQWQLGEIDNYNALQGLYHIVRWLMNASPLFNVVTDGKEDELLVKIGRDGQVYFGSELERIERQKELFFRKEMHEMIMARLIALAAWTLSSYNLSLMAEDQINAGLVNAMPSKVVEQRESICLTWNDARYLFQRATAPPRSREVSPKPKGVVDIIKESFKGGIQAIGNPILSTRKARDELERLLMGLFPQATREAPQTQKGK